MKKYIMTVCFLGMMTMTQGADKSGQLKCHSRQNSIDKKKCHSRQNSIDKKRGPVVVIEQPASSPIDKKRDMQCIKTGEELKECCYVTGLMALLIAPSAITCGLI